MLASDSVLKRCALAYIKRSGSSKKNSVSSEEIKRFLEFCVRLGHFPWSEEKFEKVYKEFIRSQNLNNGQNTGNGNGQCNEENGQTTNPQVIHVHTQNTGLSFWDCLLLQCWINSLFGGRGHTTINNITNINSHQSREDGKKDSEDSRKLLALGIVVAVACVALHIGMCFWYSSSRKAARKEEKIDYLDNKLKMFRNIEFAVSAVSLAALIYCAVNPVLPAWCLVILGVNSLVCFAGALAFHVLHGKELGSIEEAEGAVRSYLQDLDTSSRAPSYDGPPPAYSP
ncbi:hypothetical protein [Wolbachia endosymbiont of Cantharis cryptica]|uniref:hypothetical protein n=1 Tax=Wolbachia endosymbiont of Cantharis cryptica TaxID=3066132 RepID=UPI00376F3EA3